MTDALEWKSNFLTNLVIRVFSEASLNLSASYIFIHKCFHAIIVKICLLHDKSKVLKVSFGEAIFHMNQIFQEMKVLGILR